MPKFTQQNLASLANESSAVSILNSNLTNISAAIENTLSRNGTSPNEMHASLDMNNYRILNLNDAVGDQEPVTRRQLDDLVAIAIANQAAQGGSVVANSTFETYNLAKSGILAASVNIFQTHGYRTPGDFGGGVYRRLGSAPSPAYPWHIQIADGSWWQLVSMKPRPEQFGAYGDNSAHPLSNDFGSLGAAQALFPWATALTNEWDWCAITAAWKYLPKSGGTIVFQGQYLVNEVLFVGDGSNTRASTYQNIIFEGLASGVQRDLIIAPSALPSNRSVIKCTATSTLAAVIWVLGPISFSMSNMVINVDNKAARGVYLVHNMNYNISRVTVERYRDVAFDLAAFEDADTAAGVYNGHGDGLYDGCTIAQPMLTTSCGFFVGNGTSAGTGSLDVARIEFRSCQLVVGDSTNGSGFVLRFCDNINIKGCFSFSTTAKHTPFLISPAPGRTAFPQLITIDDSPMYGNQTWPDISVWNPGRRGIIFLPFRGENVDQYGLPHDPSGRVKGISMDGTWFGGTSQSFYAIGPTASVVNTSAETTFTVYPVIERRALNTNRMLTSLTHGVFRNNTGSSQTFRIRAKVDLSASVVAVSTSRSLGTSEVFALMQINGSGLTFTLTKFASTAVRANSPVWLENTGGSAVTVAPDTGATINGGGSSLSLPAGGVYRCTWDGVSNWTVTGVIIRGTIGDSGDITVASSASYKSLVIDLKIYGRGSLTTQNGMIKVLVANAGNVDTSNSQQVTEYHGLTSLLGFDHVAPYILTITIQPSAASASFDLYSLHNALTLQ